MSESMHILSYIGPCMSRDPLINMPKCAKSTCRSRDDHMIVVREYSFPCGFLGTELIRAKWKERKRRALHFVSQVPYNTAKFAKICAKARHVRYIKKNALCDFAKYVEEEKQRFLKPN